MNSRDDFDAQLEGFQARARTRSQQMAAVEARIEKDPTIILHKKYKRNAFILIDAAANMLGVIQGALDENNSNYSSKTLSSIKKGEDKIKELKQNLEKNNANDTIESEYRMRLLTRYQTEELASQSTIAAPSTKDMVKKVLLSVVTEPLTSGYTLAQKTKVKRKRGRKKADLLQSYKTNIEQLHQLLRKTNIQLTSLDKKLECKLPTIDLDASLLQRGISLFKINSDPTALDRFSQIAIQERERSNSVGKISADLKSVKTNFSSSSYTQDNNEFDTEELLDNNNNNNSTENYTYVTSLLFASSKHKAPSDDRNDQLENTVKEIESIQCLL